VRTDAKCYVSLYKQSSGLLVHLPSIPKHLVFWTGAEYSFDPRRIPSNNYSNLNLSTAPLKYQNRRTECDQTRNVMSACTNSKRFSNTPETTKNTEFTTPTWVLFPPISDFIGKDPDFPGLLDGGSKSDPGARFWHKRVKDNLPESEGRNVWGSRGAVLGFLQNTTGSFVSLETIRTKAS
jgi:hypothetical protein